MADARMDQTMSALLSGLKAFGRGALAAGRTILEHSAVDPHTGQSLAQQKRQAGQERYGLAPSSPPGGRGAATAEQSIGNGAGPAGRQGGAAMHPASSGHGTGTGGRMRAGTVMSPSTARSSGSPLGGGTRPANPAKGDGPAVPHSYGRDGAGPTTTPAPAVAPLLIEPSAGPGNEMPSWMTPFTWDTEPAGELPADRPGSSGADRPRDICQVNGPPRQPGDPSITAGTGAPLPGSARLGSWTQAVAAHADRPWTIRDFHRAGMPVGAMLKRLRQIPPGQPKIWIDTEVRGVLADLPAAKGNPAPKSRRAQLRWNLRRRKTGRHYFRDPGRILAAMRIIETVEKGRPVSARWLAERLGCSPPTAMTVLQELQRKGIVKLHRTPGGMHRYIRK